MPFLAPLAATVLKEVGRRANSKEPLGLTTGIKEIDDMLGGGWIRQNLTYIGGDSGVGKTWLVLWFLIQGAKLLGSRPDMRPMTGYMLDESIPENDWRRHVANKEGKPPIVVFWSLEMAEFLVTARIMSMVASTHHRINISSVDMLSGAVLKDPDPIKQRQNQRLMKQIYEELVEQYGSSIYMEFDAQTMDEFLAVLRKLSEKYDIVMVIIDYFRHIKGMDAGNTADTQGNKSSMLRYIARSYDCHLVCVMDITRAGQKGGVQISDLKGGTAAQYDADTVFMVRNITKEEERIGFESCIELDLAKGRNVAQGKIQLSLNLRTGVVTLWNLKVERRTL
jgi:replicative DNA helicase